MGLKPDHHPASAERKTGPDRSAPEQCPPASKTERSQEALAALKQKIWRELVEKLDESDAKSVETLPPRQSS